MPMTTKVSLAKICSKSIDSKFKMHLFRDRFDLAKLIAKICSESRPELQTYDPIKLVSLQTIVKYCWNTSKLLKICSMFRRMHGNFRLNL